MPDRQPAPDWLPTLTLAYLLGPLVIFLLTWLRPELGWPLAGLVGWSAWQLGQSLAVVVPAESRPRWFVGLLLGMASMGWAWLAGMGGFVPVHGDYEKHTRIFYDLITNAWPVQYANPARQDPFLCYYVAYYLPAAALVRGLNLPLPWADAVSFGWGWAGLWLTLCWVARLSSQWALWVAAGLFFLSGLEVPLRWAWAWEADFDMNPVTLVEAWQHPPASLWFNPPRYFFADGQWQHSLDTATLWEQLRGTPQHALGGWLAVLLAVYGQKNGWGPGRLAWLVVATLLWSPLVSVGLSVWLTVGWLIVRPPFFWRLLWQEGRWLAGAGIVGTMLLIYYAAHLPVAERGLLPLTWTSPRDALLFVFFLAGQYGLPLWLLTRLTRQLAHTRPELIGWLQLAQTSAITLGLLSLVYVGRLNDFQSRAIVPAQLVFVVAMANGVAVALRHYQHRAGWLLLTWGLAGVWPSGRSAAYVARFWYTNQPSLHIDQSPPDMSRFPAGSPSLPPGDYAAQYLGRRDSWFWQHAANR
jgi:hypothetical protein